MRSEDLGYLHIAYRWWHFLLLVVPKYVMKSNQLPASLLEYRLRRDMSSTSNSTSWISKDISPEVISIVPQRIRLLASLPFHPFPFSYIPSWNVGQMDSKQISLLCSTPSHHPINSFSIRTLTVARSGEDLISMSTRLTSRFYFEIQKQTQSRQMESEPYYPLFQSRLKALESSSYRPNE